MRNFLRSPEVTPPVKKVRLLLQNQSPLLHLEANNRLEEQQAQQIWLVKVSQRVPGELGAARYILTMMVKCMYSRPLGKSDS